MPKVLIVEDDQFIREMYAMILTKAGYDVTEAQDGAAGLVVAKHGGYDCILLDLMMPQMDGLTFLKELKKTPPPKENGAILIMSNLAYVEAKDEATELGASDFFVKADLDPKEIVALVDKATKK
jgi:DNA-binding response OmpR family regulator